MRTPLKYVLIILLGTAYLPALGQVVGKNEAWQLSKLSVGLQLGSDQPALGNRDFLLQHLVNPAARVMISNDSLRPGVRYQYAVPQFQLGLRLEKHTPRGNMRYLNIRLEVMPPQRNYYSFVLDDPTVRRTIRINQGELNFATDYNFVKNWKRIRLQIGFGIRGGGSFLSEMTAIEGAIVEFFPDNPPLGPGLGGANFSGLNRGMLIQGIRIPIRPSLYYRTYIPARVEVQVLPSVSLEIGAEFGLGLQHILGGSIFALPPYGRLQAGCLFLLGP